METKIHLLIWVLLVFQRDLTQGGESISASTESKVAPECPVEISPQRAVVRYGDPVTAKCTTTQTARGIGWEATVGATGMKTDVQSVTWNVSSLTDWTAEPKCYGNFLTEPKQCGKNLIIILYKYPDSVSLSSDSPVDQMVEGIQYQLQCEIKNIAPIQYLTVNWYRGQTLIHSQTFSHNTTRTPVNVSATLLFTPDRADNGQQLTCEAELNLGPEGPQPPPANQSDPLRITVLYKPQFVQSTESLSLAAGGSVVLNCSAEGSPLPQYHWRYLEAPNVQDSSTGGWSVVNITAATPENSGQYTCTARNYLGDTTRAFTLTVREDEEGAVPDCPLEISPQRVVVRYGDPVTANCTTTQTARGIGWEATVGSTGMKADVQSVTWNVSSLTDWTAEPKCYGNFLTEPKQCRKNLNISLYKYPDSVSVNQTVQMVEGRQYQLQCEVQNIAPVQYLTVNWYRGKTLIHSQTFSHNTTRTPVNVSATLLFTPDRPDNGQQLTCEAELNLGPEGPQPPPANQSDPLRITVLYGLVITCPPSATVEEGQSLERSVPCTAMGNPPPDTQWLIDAQKTVPDGPLSRRDTGLFTFQAENRYGRVKQNVNITVIYKPQFVQSNESLSLVAGGSVVLNCSAEGSPLPQYHWRYPKAPNVQDSSTGGWSVVNITAATPENSGQYTCTARNHLGDTARTFTLTVEQKSRASEDCPIQIRPSRLVVRYGDPVRAECTATQPLRGMGWEATAGPTGMQIVSQVVTWNVSSLTDWTSEPKCFGNFYQTPKQCEKKLTIVLYKLPDSVSLNQTVQMEEGRQYQLQCAVQNIAPVQYLTVNWYRGKTLIHSQTFSHNTTRTPVNVSATLLFTPDRADNGQQFTCEAELNLGPEGPQPPPAKRGKPVMITVLYDLKDYFMMSMALNSVAVLFVVISVVLCICRRSRNES
ncbi:vascular cell adhesion protein 1 isoform X5 [Lepisosteus oculatus]|uniref:vascular cell adhesion protein 1 isoform X5 n=1 Tax=Lepisosteus oculatus TaxID=7918 RepID=UPI0035F52ACB